MSMFTDYVKERLGDSSIETEHGFAIYRYPDDKTVYIVDIYIVPKARKQGVGSEMADYIMGIAKNRGCTRMIGSVVPSAKGSTESIKTLLAYGMRLQSSTNDFILFEKEIT